MNTKINLKNFTRVLHFLFSPTTGVIPRLKNVDDQKFILDVSGRQQLFYKNVRKNW